MNLHRLSPLLLGLFLLSTPALADGPSDFDRNTARTLGQEGHVALDKGDFTTAADRFSRADQLIHAPTFLLGLAEAQVGLGKLVSALESYNRIVREGVPDKAPEPFVRALAAAKKESEALAPRIPYVVIEVRGAPPGARVTLNDIEVPPAALGVKRAVDPGKHVVRVTAQGFVTAESTFTIGEGKTQTVTLEPAKVPATTTPKAATATATASVPPPPVTSAPVVPPPPDKGSLRPTLGIVGLVAGGAGLALGAVMGGLALGKHDEIAGKCPSGHCLPSDQTALGPQIDTYHTLGLVSTIGFIAGGVLAGAGVVLLVTAPSPKPSSSRVHLQPVVGAGFAGVKGAF